MKNRNMSELIEILVDTNNQLKLLDPGVEPVKYIKLFEVRDAVQASLLNAFELFVEEVEKKTG